MRGSRGRRPASVFSAASIAARTLPLHGARVGWPPVWAGGSTALVATGVLCSDRRRARRGAHVPRRARRPTSRSTSRPPTSSCTTPATAGDPNFTHRRRRPGTSRPRASAPWPTRRPSSASRARPRRGRQDRRLRLRRQRTARRGRSSRTDPTRTPPGLDRHQAGARRGPAKRHRPRDLPPPPGLDLRARERVAQGRPPPPGRLTGSTPIPRGTTSPRPSCSGRRSTVPPADLRDGHEGRGYSQWVFFEYLSEHFGVSIVRDIFEASKTLGATDHGPHSLAAIQQVLAARGHGLAKVFPPLHAGEPGRAVPAPPAPVRLRRDRARHRARDQRARVPIPRSTFGWTTSPRAT